MLLPASEVHTVASGPVDEASLRYPLVEVGVDFGADARDVLQGRCPTHCVVGDIRSVVVALVQHEVDSGFPTIPLTSLYSFLYSPVLTPLRILTLLIGLTLYNICV